MEFVHRHLIAIKRQPQTRIQPVPTSAVSGHLDHLRHVNTVVAHTLQLQVGLLWHTAEVPTSAVLG